MRSPRVYTDKDIERSHAFDGFSALDRGMIIGNALDATQRAADTIHGGIRLPSKIKLIFTPSAKTTSDQKVIKYGVGHIAEHIECQSSLAGLAGHELSHLADLESDLHRHYVGWFGRTISEGKAEMIALEVSPESYQYAFQSHPLFGPNGMLRHFLEVEAMTRSERANPDVFDPYTLGEHFVRSIMDQNGSTIYDIHPQPIDFYEQQLQHMKQEVMV